MTALAFALFLLALPECSAAVRPGECCTAVYDSPVIGIVGPLWRRINADPDVLIDYAKPEQCVPGPAV